MRRKGDRKEERNRSSVSDRIMVYCCINLFCQQVLCWQVIRSEYLNFH